MRNTKALQKRKKILHSPITLVILFLVLIFFARTAWRMQSRSNIIGQRLHDTKANLQELERRNADLIDRVSNLSTEDGIVGEMRTRYKVAKDGESVAIIVGEKVHASTSADRAITEHSVWRSLFSWFGI